MISAGLCANHIREGIVERMYYLRTRYLAWTERIQMYYTVLDSYSIIKGRKIIIITISGWVALETK